jgi:hypothetical protein
MLDLGRERKVERWRLQKMEMRRIVERLMGATAMIICKHPFSCPARLHNKGAKDISYPARDEDGNTDGHTEYEERTSASNNRSTST